MRKAVPAIVLLLALCAARPAMAGFAVAASIGEGMVIHDDEVYRTPVNFEVLPSYGVGIVKMDLGMVFHVEDRVDMLLRPGVRVDLWILYARAAIPLKVTGDFDWGFMLGLGGNLVNLGIVSLFLEADASFYESSDFEIVPLEARLGVEIGF